MNAIVTTTINSPTEGIRRFAEMPEWTLYVVADRQTPDAEFASLPCIYLDCDEQGRRWPALSELIGWGKAERRVLGFLAAIADGASVIASVDDDIVPRDGWGSDLIVGSEVDVDVWESDSGVVDPYAVCDAGGAWHRGYPIDLLPQRNCRCIGKQRVVADFQVELSDGQLDVDAFFRLQSGANEPVRFGPFAPFAASQPAPFSTQCTFFTAAAARSYMMPLGVGRVHDIWASWAAQSTGFRPVFCPPSSTHVRKPRPAASEWRDELATYGLSRDAVSKAHEWHAAEILAYKAALKC